MIHQLRMWTPPMGNSIKNRPWKYLPPIGFADYLFIFPKIKKKIGIESQLQINFLRLILGAFLLITHLSSLIWLILGAMIFLLIVWDVNLEYSLYIFRYWLWCWNKHNFFTNIEWNYFRNYLLTRETCPSHFTDFCDVIQYTPTPFLLNFGKK